LLSRAPEEGLQLVSREDFWNFAAWTLWDFISQGLNLYVVFSLLLVTRRVWRAANLAEGTAASPRLRYLFVASLLAISFGSPAITAVG
ncbi:MAG: hypothetical protein KC431_04140, partial [Myxococcales bacterium]|nr:hypothetical protein [Myxococcales bacterium]